MYECLCVDNIWNNFLSRKELEEQETLACQCIEQTFSICTWPILHDRRDATINYENIFLFNFFQHDFYPNRESEVKSSSYIYIYIQRIIWMECVSVFAVSLYTNTIFTLFVPDFSSLEEEINILFFFSVLSRYNQHL